MISNMNSLRYILKRQRVECEKWKHFFTKFLKLGSLRSTTVGLPKENKKGECMLLSTVQVSNVLAVP